MAASCPDSTAGKSSFFGFPFRLRFFYVRIAGELCLAPSSAKPPFLWCIFHRMKTSGMHKSESRVDVATLSDNEPNQGVANAVGKQRFLPRSGRSGIVESASMIPFASPLLPLPCRGRYPPCRLCTTRKKCDLVVALCIYREVVGDLGTAHTNSAVLQISSPGVACDMGPRT